MAAIAILTPIAKSHPFSERKIKVEGQNKPTKIGREIVKSKAEEGNAIFDCKVLSRNHAVMWYTDGNFFLKDTKSSNGTFVNNERLSAASEESVPRVIYTGDVIQLGVEIVENTNKVAHGCIYAMVQLFNEFGTTINRPSTKAEEESTLKSACRLFQMEKLMGEIEHRERQRVKNIDEMEALSMECMKHMETAWKSMVNEERLLARIETLEGQLSAYAESTTVEAIRLEMSKMVEDKSQFEAITKDFIRKKLDENEELQSRLNDTKKSLAYAEQSCQQQKELLEDVNKKLLENAEKYDEQSKAYDLALRTIVDKEEETTSLKDSLEDAKSRLSNPEAMTSFLCDHLIVNRTWFNELDMLVQVLKSMGATIGDQSSQDLSPDVSKDNYSEVSMDISTDEKENRVLSSNCDTAELMDFSENEAKESNDKLQDSVTELQLKLADAHEQIKTLQESIALLPQPSCPDPEFHETGERWYMIPSTKDTKFEAPAYLMSILPLFIILLVVIGQFVGETNEDEVEMTEAKKEE